MRQVTREDVIQGLNRIKESVDPYRSIIEYDEGLYSYESGGHCLVGEFLTRENLPCPTVFDSRNGMPINNIIDEGFFEAHGVNFEHEALSILQVAQELQDDGQTWHYAIEESLKCSSGVRNVSGERSAT